MMRSRIAYLVFATLALPFLPSCGSDCVGNACSVSGSAPPPPDVSGGGCDATKPPSEGGCAVSETDGYFVAPSGSDAGPGTRAAPYATIQRGIEQTKTGAKRNVYVCEGTYDETLLVTIAALGVAIHGGFRCPGAPNAWAYTGAATTVAPSKVGYALRVVGSPAVLEDMAVVAKDAVAPGESSVAVFIEAAPGMTFRRAKVIAGNGVKGTGGASVAAFSGPASLGGTAVAYTPGDGPTCACGSKSSVGGNGGGGTANRAPTAGTPLIPNASSTSGQPYTGNPACTGGLPGAYDGASAVAGGGGGGASSSGQLSSQGWLGAPGVAGVDGAVGQGGGGSLGNSDLASGGGGCGGCGGKAGGGGTTGGSSLAIAALNSTVRLQGSVLQTGSGADGGAGGDAQVGQEGGDGGQGTALGGAAGTGCRGGKGGSGGSGGGGGGGAGGASIAIAYVGTPPIVDDPNALKVGAAGRGGAGGGPPASKGSAGADGVAVAQRSF